MGPNYLNNQRLPAKAYQKIKSGDCPQIGTPGGKGRENFT